jgi:hypothetical protein
MRVSGAFVAITVLLIGAVHVRADPMDVVTVADFVTPTGASTGGGPVNAEAVFKWDPDVGILSLTLTNKEANITDVAQALSDLSFTTGTSETINTYTSSGTERTVNSGGTFTDGSSVATGWILTPATGTPGSSFEVDVLGAGGAGPAHLIIGPPGAGPLYSNANGSIAGNGPHNPFLATSATFNFTLADKTDVPNITGATFSFGTTAGIDVPGVPEPAMLISSVGGLTTLGLLAFRRKRES